MKLLVSTMDMGYDSKDIYSVVMNDFNAQAIIPINSRGSIKN
ncbi:hypothetical protein [Desulforamulus reducens]|nr:hypothetical protein [Desulforamulus reducens]